VIGRTLYVNYAENCITQRFSITDNLYFVPYIYIYIYIYELIFKQEYPEL